MRVATEHLLYGDPDFPDLLPLTIIMHNTSARAICLPLNLAPYPDQYINDLFRVWDLETGTEVRQKFKGFVSDTSDMHDNVRIIPPGEGTRFHLRPSDDFNLKSTRKYRALYDVEGYFCDAFNGGYPHTDEAYIEQERSEILFFDRSPATVVKFRAELIFEAP